MSALVLVQLEENQLGQVLIHANDQLLVMDSRDHLRKLQVEIGDFLEAVDLADPAGVAPFDDGAFAGAALIDGGF